MKFENNDSFSYTSNSNNGHRITKIELFMQKVQVAKDISKFKILHNNLLPQLSSMFKKEASHLKHSKLYKSV